MKVDVRRVLALKTELALINSVPLERVQFYDGNKELSISAADLEDWNFIGLNNTSFVEIILSDRLDSQPDSSQVQP